MRLLWIGGLATLAACGGPGTTDATSTDASLRGASAERLADLAAVRAATARYHDLDAALADGFVQVSGCVSSPLGTMGYHYLRFDRLLDGEIVAEEPELLVYAPSGDGLRLVAVEYMLPIVDAAGAPYVVEPPASAVPPAPTVLGATFDGPMPGHAPGEPWHFDLHAWIWSHNPSGTFAQFNPALSCE